MPSPILGEQDFAPNASTPAYMTRFWRNPTTGLMSVQYTTNSGSTWIDFVSQPGPLATEGWVISLDANLNPVWQPLATILKNYNPPSNPITQGWADMSFPASLYINHQFGYFNVPANTNLSLVGVQMSVFTPSAGADITAYLVQVVNGLPQVTGTYFTLPSGQLSRSVSVTPVTMAQNTSWALTLSSVGSTEPGEFLSCRLLFNTIS